MILNFCLLKNCITITARVICLEMQQIKQDIDSNLLLQKQRTFESKAYSILAAITDILLVINLQDGKLGHIEIIPSKSTLVDEFGIDLICTKIEQIFREETSKVWLEKVWLVLKKKQVLNFDYPLNFQEKEFWFNATISPISDQSVLWVAREDSFRREKMCLSLTARSLGLQLKQLLQKLDSYSAGLSKAQIQNLLGWDAHIVDAVIELGLASGMLIDEFERGEKKYKR